MSVLLDHKHLTPSELLDLSTYTILVIPTLGYYFAALFERPAWQAWIAPLLADGTLFEALYRAASIVRLLNDLGTPLITLDGHGREELFKQLLSHLEERRNRKETLCQFLAAIGEEIPLLARLRKDAELGELNVCLYGIGHHPANLDALDRLKQSLAVFSHWYADQSSGIAKSILQLQERMDPRAGELLLRFVRFHEELYSHPYDTLMGEYAILNE